MARSLKSRKRPREISLKNNSPSARNPVNRSQLKAISLKNRLRQLNSQPQRLMTKAARKQKTRIHLTRLSNQALGNKRVISPPTRAHRTKRPWINSTSRPTRLAVNLTNQAKLVMSHLNRNNKALAPAV